METLIVNHIRPLTEFRNKMKEYINELNENRTPILIIELMRKFAQGLEDYKNDRVHSVEETFSTFDKIIKAVLKFVRIATPFSFVYGFV